MGGFDPNNLSGPGGFGPAHVVAGEQTLPYTIAFENDPHKATAPAQEVVVTEALDPNLDWSTFQLGAIQFGATAIQVPTGLQSFASSVSATNVDGTPLRVDISAGLNLQTGVVTWTFRSIDPATGLLPANVLAGFLPVDDSTGRGQAFVNYTIRPKASDPTGTVVSAQATVVFDTNAPLNTNTASNSIDAGAPTSSVNLLPATTTSTTFTVSWSGQDDAGGSGIKSYDVYVSDNGGVSTPFLTGTAQTSATFTGQFGHTYAFYTVATDNVGHVQATPTAPQASTTLQQLTPPIPPLPPPLPPIVVQDVTALVSVTRVKSKRHGSSRLTLALKNIGGTDLVGPLSLVLTGLRRKVKLRNSTGFTQVFAPAKRPYLDIALPGGIFHAGATLTVTLIFSGPGILPPKFRPQVLAGPGPR